MTVYGSFDLEDDDFFDDTFRNISDAELSSHTANVLPASTSTNHEPDHLSTEMKFQEKSQAETCSPLLEQNLNSIKNDSFSGLHENKQSSQNLPDKSNADKVLSSTPNIILGINTEKAAIINSRFTPGFTPIVKKRKFPGPAGVFSEKDDGNIHPEVSNHLVKKKIEAEIKVQDITNSQFSADDLLLPSWQNLQADVSSKNLLSTAKYYSIRRVYTETSKKKLPKHIVVPVLCVLLKKFNLAEHSVFIDDTGEITGKIDQQVLVKFEEYLKDGVSLILKKVTFLCNVLLLTQQSIVSIYLDDGTVKHVQEVDSVPCREEPLKPMSCQCSATPTAKAARNQTTSYSSGNSPAIPQSCIHRAIDNVAGSHLVPKTQQVVGNNCHYTNTNSSKFSKERFTKSVSTRVPSTDCIKFPALSASVPSESKMTSDSCDVPNGPSHTSANGFSQAMNCNLKAEQAVSENSNQKNRQDESVKALASVHSSETSDLFGGNSDLDEFDALLGTLDEKSFLEEF